MGNKTLKTERLLLRPWRESDFPPFAQINADPRVMEYFPAALSSAESDQLASRIREGFIEREYRLWAVEVLGVADFIGFAGLAVPKFEAHFTPCVEVGWRIAYAHWGNGYATEAARAVATYAFSELNLDEIVSFTVAGNRRSRRVMEKLGMVHRAEENFDHPSLPEGHALRQHVLCRLGSTQWSNFDCYLKDQ